MYSPRHVMLLLVPIALTAFFPSRPAHTAPILSAAPRVQDKAGALLRSARSLRCSFDSGTGVILNKTPPQAIPDRLLDPVVFDNIDRATGQARFLAFGATDVTVIAGANVLSFLHSTPISASLYTVFGVFKPGALGDELLAVASLHGSMPGPTGELVYGTCRVMQ